MSLKDFEGMHWKPLEEMDSSYVAMMHFKRLLENLKERNPRKLYCSLDEELNYTELPGLVTADGDLIAHGRVKLPLSANFLFKVRDGLNEIDVNFVGYVSRELDQDNKFKGYPARIIQELRHQGGIRLRHLLSLNLDEIYFRNQFEREGALIKVDERLVESLLISGIEAKMDTIHC